VTTMDLQVEIAKEGNAVDVSGACVDGKGRADAVKYTVRGSVDMLGNVKLSLADVEAKECVLFAGSVNRKRGVGWVYDTDWCGEQVVPLAEN
jgi:hypothetical protein